MNWFESLCKLYSENEQYAGRYMKGRWGEDLILLPIYHNTVIAHITVYILSDGSFVYAKPVDREESITIIPVTEMSAVRTNNCVAHPLCDGLKYVAGDYVDYCDIKELGKAGLYYKNYKDAISSWGQSEYSHPKVNAILSYIEKGCIVKDLVSCGCLILDDDGRLSKNVKINGIEQGAAVVRFHVLEDPVNDVESLQARPEDEKCWVDRTLQEKWIEYCRSQDNMKEKCLSYGSGEMVRVSYNNPKKIRNDGDSTKLISFHDQIKNNHFLFTRFQNEEESVQLGYEEMQKVYNALKWIIRKQGAQYGELCIVFYINGSGDKFPLITDGTEDICKNYENSINGQIFETDIPSYEIVQRDAQRLARAMMGYEEVVPENMNMRYIALKGSTPGRLAIVENHTIRTGEYVQRIKSWHEDMAFLQLNNEGEWHYGTYDVHTMFNILYGDDKDSRYLVVHNKNMRKREPMFTVRMINCILYGDPLPVDIVNMAVDRASSPQSYEQWYNWEMVLAFACACIKKKAKEENAEGCGVALNRKCLDRSYLYGRLLAVADRIEYRTFGRGNHRNTNAKKYMTTYSAYPFRTWKVIEERAQFYYKKLKPTEAMLYQREIMEIMNLFDEKDFMSSDPLDSMYLLGYHNEAAELRKIARKTEEKGEE